MRPSHPFLPRGRRFLAAVIVLVLLAPTLGMLASPHRDRSVMERRLLATFPQPPRRPAGWAAYPGALDDYFRDHFSGREPLIFADLWLSARVRLKPASAVGTTVLQGEGDWLLLEPGLEGAGANRKGMRRARMFAARPQTKPA